MSINTNAPGENFGGEVSPENMTSDDDLRSFLAAQQRAETQFARPGSLPGYKAPLQGNFFTEDDTLNFS